MIAPMKWIAILVCMSQGCHCLSAIPRGDHIPRDIPPVTVNKVSRRQCLGVLPTTLLPLTLGPFPASAVENPTLAQDFFGPSQTAPSAGRSFFPTLTPPFFHRATFRRNVGRNAWEFEQLLAFVNVTATIKCHAIQLESTGGLWIHSPQWPTKEFCHLLDDLGRPVEHIVLPCNALEHKAPMKAFVQRYPNARVWIAPGQYGPFGSCGQIMQDPIKMGYRVDGVLGDPTIRPPWIDEFEMATLYVNLPKNAGPVSEVAFCHKPSKTLIATDAVVYIPKEEDARLDIFRTYFDQEIVEQDPSFWARTVLQAVFLPLRTNDSGQYPGYEVLKDRLVRAPILRGFVDARAPTQVQAWTEQITQWNFDRILTSHFASPIVAGPRDFANAFAYLPKSTGDPSFLPPIACQDWELLQQLNDVIAANDLGAPTVFDYKNDCLR